MRSEASQRSSGVAYGRRAATPEAQAEEPQQGRISRAAASASSEFHRASVSLGAGFAMGAVMAGRVSSIA
jgi:hypothetical protein